MVLVIKLAAQIVPSANEMREGCEFWMQEKVRFALLLKKVRFSIGELVLALLTSFIFDSY